MDKTRQITCPSCGAHIEIPEIAPQASPIVGAAHVAPRPVALPPEMLDGRTALQHAKFRKTLMWIMVFGVLSAAWGLYFSDLWTAMPADHDRFRTFTRLCAFFNLPLDSLLLVTSIALLTAGRSWARRGILAWAVAASVFQTIVVLATMLWIAPSATMQDVSPDEAQLLPLISSTPGQAINGDATFAWISIMFLSTWIGWALTRPKMKDFCELPHAADAPKIS